MSTRGKYSLVNDNTDNAPDEEKKELNEQSRDEGTELLKEAFYIYHKRKISGPHNHHDIFKLYFSSEISDTIWVKNVKLASEHGKWIKIDLTAKTSNDIVKNTYPDLYNYLIPKLETRSIQQYEQPVDIPKDASDHMSIERRFIQIIGIVFAIIGFVIIFIHIIITFLIASICWYLPCVYCSKADEAEKQTKLILGTLIIGTSGFLITPPIIVYLVLLKWINYEAWNAEIQSWMIAYITWGVFTYLFILIIWIFGVLEKLAAAKKMVFCIFWISGIEFDFIEASKLFTRHWKFVILTVAIFPALAALLPSIIIGFIANYIVEEQFILDCGEDVTNDTLCFSDDGYGCCEVISSHDIRNSYTFIGGLASNILATWAIIRLVGYLMVNITPEISMFAKRNQ